MGRSLEGEWGPPTRFTPNPGTRGGKYGQISASIAAPSVVGGPHSPSAERPTSQAPDTRMVSP